MMGAVRCGGKFQRVVVHAAFTAQGKGGIGVKQQPAPASVVFIRC